MENQLGVYILIFSAFTGGSIYNIRISKQNIYSVKLRIAIILILISASIIFFAIGYIGGNSWDNYLLVFSGILLIISSVKAQGIHKEGIYYRARGVLIRLAKWEDIKDIKIDINKNMLKSFKINTLTIFANQYYSSEDIKKIEEYIG